MMTNPVADTIYKQQIMLLERLQLMSCVELDVDGRYFSARDRIFYLLDTPLWRLVWTLSNCHPEIRVEKGALSRWEEVGRLSACGFAMGDPLPAVLAEALAEAKRQRIARGVAARPTVVSL